MTCENYYNFLPLSLILIRKCKKKSFISIYLQATHFYAIYSPIFRTKDTATSNLFTTLTTETTLFDKPALSVGTVTQEKYLVTP